MATETGNDQNKDGSEGSKLREQLEAALGENRKLKRNLAVQKSGLDPEKNKLHALFVNSYEGDWDPEAFTAEAKELFGEEDKGSQKKGEQKASTEEDDGSGGDEGSDENPSYGQMYDKVFNATAEGGRDLPANEKSWAKAQSPEEFLAKYDGRVA